MKVDYKDLKRGDTVTMVNNHERVTLNVYRVGESKLYGNHRLEIHSPDASDNTFYRHDPVDTADLRKGDRVLAVLNDGSRIDTKVLMASAGAFESANNFFPSREISKLYLLDRAAPKLTDYVTASAAAMIEEHFTVVPK